MARLAFYIFGASTFLTAWVVYKRAARMRRVPVKKAAALLQEAWSDYHTRA